MTEQNRNEAEEIQASPRLVEALNQLQRQRIFVPPAVDEAVMRQARAHLQKSERPQFAWKSPVSWAAMAACLALALWLAEHFNKPGAPFAPEDINHDGRVDILDAFALARRIETGKNLDPGWDINGDGRIDRADVNAVAAQAVSLSQTAPARRAEAKRGEAVKPGSREAVLLGLVIMSDGARALASFKVRNDGALEKTDALLIRALKRRERRAPSPVQIDYPPLPDTLETAVAHLLPFSESFRRRRFVPANLSKPRNKEDHS